MNGFRTFLPAVIALGAVASAGPARAEDTHTRAAIPNVSAERAKVVLAERSQPGGKSRANVPPLEAIARKLGRSVPDENTLAKETHECIPRSISCGGTASATLTSHSCTSSTSGLYGLFHFFTGTQGTIVTVTATSTAFDVAIGLVDPSSAVVAVDDNSAGGTNARLTFTLTSTGTWSIGVINSANFATGSYTLTLSCQITPGTAAYSAELPVLARVQGTAFFRTAVDISNNTNKNGVLARYQFAYTCVATTCSPQGGFYRTPVQTITLQGLDTFHQDDFIQYLDSLSLLQPGAVQGSIGTLLVNFENLDSGDGWEGSVTGRTYNRIVETDPSRGTVGFAYNASLFFESADTTLVGTLRDTKSSPTVAGMLRSNLGIRNTDINGTNQRVSVEMEFYDTATGTRVGNRIPFNNLEPGELRQISDVWATALIPATVTSVIAFADVLNPTATSPTIEGYVTIIDGQSTQDAAFFEMKCGDANLCGN